MGLRNKAENMCRQQVLGAIIRYSRGRRRLSRHHRLRRSFSPVPFNARTQMVSHPNTAFTCPLRYILIPPLTFRGSARSHVPRREPRRIMCAYDDRQGGREVRARLAGYAGRIRTSVCLSSKRASSPLTPPPTLSATTSPPNCMLT